MNVSRFIRYLRGAPGDNDSFDVSKKRSWHSIRFSNGDRLDGWDLAEAETSVEGAARAALGLWRDHPKIRHRFPHVLAEGKEGSYANWLASAGALELGLTSRTVQNFRAAFHTAGGHRVLQVYLHSPKLQTRFPRALLTVAQKSFGRWLLRGGRKRYLFTNEEIVWFLHETAEDLPKMVLWTWLINPSWQSKFPLAHASTIPLFLDWVRQELAGCPGYSQLEALPSVLGEFQKSLPTSVYGKAAGGVNILSHFCYPSGIQQAASQTARAFENVGVNVSLRDVPTSPRFDLEARERFLGLEVFPVTIANVAPQPFFKNIYEWSGLMRASNAYRIAYWAWELDDIPPSWIELAPLIDEIWAPTKFVADAFRRRMPNPIYEMLLPVQIDQITPFDRAQFGIAPENYIFFFMFDMCSVMIRKNPLAVIRAFQAAFPNPRDVTLVIKVSRGSWNPAGLLDLQQASAAPNIILIDDVIPHAQALGLMQMCDCFVSLHRAEGFGLCLAEAMLMGKPVIATNYSGNLAFMRADNSLLVDYKLTEIVEDTPVYPKGNHWAEPSLEHSAAYMRWCYEHRAEAAALGLNAQTDICNKLSLEVAGQRMRARLAKIRTGLAEQDD